VNINVTYDSSVASAPAAFTTAITYVVNLFDSLFANPVSVNIDVGYGEIGGQSLSSGVLGASETYRDPLGYSQAANAVKANGASAAQQAAYATLPTQSPLSGGTLWLATAQEKALGLLSASANIDGYVGFSSAYPFSYSATATPAQNQYYFVGVVEHEFSEIMGRVSFLGDTINGTTSYSIMDLFRYSAPGVRDLTAKPPVANTAYFSTDSGNTNLGNWNTKPSGDLGDWAASAGKDAYLAFSPGGQINSVTPIDLALMNVLGWNAPVSAVTVTNGESVYVSSGETSDGLIVLSGASLKVLSGGTAVDATLSGGTMQVDAGGTSIATVLSNGGQEFVNSGGTTTGTTVSNGGFEVIESGGIATSSTLTSGGYEYLLSGGTRLPAHPAGWVGGRHHRLQRRHPERRWGRQQYQPRRLPGDVRRCDRQQHRHHQRGVPVHPARRDGERYEPSERGGSER
jgi:autotransporter passenger strand-loop-strand repeat protein